MPKNRAAGILLVSGTRVGRDRPSLIISIRCFQMRCKWQKERGAPQKRLAFPVACKSSGSQLQWLASRRMPISPTTPAEYFHLEESASRLICRVQMSIADRIRGGVCGAGAACGPVLLVKAVYRRLHRSNREYCFIQQLLRRHPEGNDKGKEGEEHLLGVDPVRLSRVHPSIKVNILNVLPPWSTALSNADWCVCAAPSVGKNWQGSTTNPRPRNRKLILQIKCWLL